MCARERRPLPRAIANAPELNLGLEFAYSSFWELSSCRPTGWGFGPIPYSTIADFIRAQELDEDDGEDFFYLIRAMDKAFLEYHAEKENTKPKSPVNK